jgi:inositol transport system substrate-binding protein
MKHLYRVLSVLLVFVFLMGACAPKPAAEETGPKKYTICFAFQDLETEFWMAGHKAITETLAAKGYEVVEVNSGSDANKQLEQVKNCIAQKVDGIMVIPVDGSIALKLIAEANKAEIPIGIFNRPPQNEEGNALTVVANNEKIAQATVEYMAEEAKKLGRKMKPLIMVGDLGDPNAVGRQKGFYNVINANPDLFETPVEVATKWDASVALAGLQAAMTANPDIDFIFTSSDFLYPTIQSVLEPMGKWKPIGDPDHVLMGGLDGDKTACSLMQPETGFVDATGVQDLYFEADALLKAIVEAVEKGEKQPDAWIDDAGFALTQGNMAERENDMWGCKLFNEAGGAAAAVEAAPVVEEGTKICFAFQDLETEFWMAGHKAITETLAAKGYEVVEVNSGSDANKQLEQVKNCIAQQVDGIMVIPVDGSIALKLIAEANKADIPIGIFNRPPQNEEGNALTVVANNEKIAQAAVEYMAEEAKKLGRKMKPLIMVGDLGDPNAVGRKQGFYNVINANPDLFETPVEVATKWDASVALAGLQAAMTANPDIDFIFTSSDFLYPTIQSVLEPMGKWKKIGEEGHVIMGGLDGDKTACSLMQPDNAYVDATGVQDLYFEADSLLAAIMESVTKGETQPDAWLDDPGFALTQGNMAERENDMWGCKLFNGK